MKTIDINSSPRTSNTGAQNTQKNRVLLDWCGFTVPNEIDFTNIINIPFDYFEELPKGINGYRKQAVYQGISIQWDGQENMGIHIEMSGKGCRTFEGFNGPIVWQELFTLIIEMGGHFTRIDLALDDFEGLLNMRTIEVKVRRGHVRSKWKDARVLNKINLQEGEYRGRTVYFGSSSSRIIARFYDKALEQKSKGIENVPDHWVRCEMQCRDERAKKIVDYIICLDQAPLGMLTSMFLRNYLEFLNPSKLDRNKSRWTVSKWWDDFLRETDKLKLTIIPEKRDIEKIKHWLKNQVSASLAMLSYSSNGELKDLEQVIELAIQGKEKLKNKHYQIIREYEEKKIRAKAPKLKRYLHTLNSKKIFHFHII